MSLICDMMIEMMRPYKPMASAKIIMRIMATNMSSLMALARTPLSPTIPMAYPAAMELKPTQRPLVSS